MEKEMNTLNHPYTYRSVKGKNGKKKRNGQEMPKTLVQSRDSLNAIHKLKIKRKSIQLFVCLLKTFLLQSNTNTIRYV